MRAERMKPCKIVDTSSPLLLDDIRKVKRAGYAGIVRYVPYVGSVGARDITAEELGWIVGEGLAALLVQHCRLQWDPAKLRGEDDAAAAVSRAIAVNYPKEAHVYLDLEGIVGSKEGTIEYTNRWCTKVVKSGYSAGIYVGFGVPLTPRELWLIHDANTYWSDPGTRQVAERGFAMKQGAQFFIDGTPYDPDIVSVDHKGQTPIAAIL